MGEEDTETAIAKSGSGLSQKTSKFIRQANEESSNISRVIKGKQPLCLWKCHCKGHTASSSERAWISVNAGGQETFADKGHEEVALC